MRIAQVSPLYESVPPKKYGGTERVVSWLTEELVRMGHDVTLFASGDSETSARLVPCCGRGLRLDSNVLDPIIHHVLLVEKVFQMADEFDVVHFHIDPFHFPIARRHDVPHVTTLHGRLDLPDYSPFFDEYRDMPVVSISDSQRRPLPCARFLATVHHGMPPDLFEPVYEPGEYLAFLGRISPEKRPDRAIRIAQRARVPLKIAAKVDRKDQEYFETEIVPLMRDANVEFVGEIDERGKQAFLGHARGLLFPIDWPEPFGLVMIEAMACGTPVLAYRCGSVPEVMIDGVTGFVVEDDDTAFDVVHRLGEIDRRMVRRAFEERFVAERMARAYVDVYEQLSRRPEGVPELRVA